MKLTVTSKMPARDEKKAREVRQSDLPVCVGNPNHKCGIKADPAIKGYDGKWRCYPCNDIHSELVLAEAGEGAPDASQPRFISVAPDPVQKERLAAILKDTESAIESGRPLALGGEHLDDEGAWRDANKVAREQLEEARARQAKGSVQVVRTSVPTRRVVNDDLKAILRKHGVVK